jgi:hypothetical protein
MVDRVCEFPKYMCSLTMSTISWVFGNDARDKDIVTPENQLSPMALLVAQRAARLNATTQESEGNANGEGINPEGNGFTPNDEEIGSNDEETTGRSNDEGIPSDGQGHTSE